MAWCVYVLRCCDGTLYTGVTTDLERRIKIHNSGKGSAYTRSRRPVRLIFKEPCHSRASALKREAQIKDWPKIKKEAFCLAENG